MEVTEYVRQDAVGLARLVADGQVSAAEVESAAREAAAEVAGRVNAVVETWPSDDAPVPGSSPLAGVPFLGKDIGVA
ncbi:amidase, partial [Streptomyces olivaceus]